MKKYEEEKKFLGQIGIHQDACTDSLCRDTAEFLKGCAYDFQSAALKVHTQENVLRTKNLPLLITLPLPGDHPDKRRKVGAPPSARDYFF